MKSKVLVACPVWHGDKQNMKQFQKQYKEHDILLVDNTLDKGQYKKYLNKIGFKKVMRHKWNPKNTYVLGMLADCCEKIRDYVVVHKEYTHWFWTAPDITTHPEAVQQLLNHDKDIVGFPTNMYSKEGPPVVLKDGELRWNGKTKSLSLNIYNWEELKQEEKLISVHGLGGATLYKREVLEKCHFRHHPMFLWGEDMWWFTECSENGFQAWCDLSNRAINHMNIPLDKKLENKMNMFTFLLEWVKKYPDNFYRKMLE